MKNTGVVRNVDQLGRIVLPSELRQTLNLNEGTPVEFYVDGDRVIIKKYNPGCYLCENVEGKMVEFYPGKLVCRECIQLASKVKEGME